MTAQLIIVDIDANEIPTAALGFTALAAAAGGNATIELAIRPVGDGANDVDHGELAVTLIGVASNGEDMGLSIDAFPAGAPTPEGAITVDGSDPLACAALAARVYAHVRQSGAAQSAPAAQPAARPAAPAAPAVPAPVAPTRAPAAYLGNDRILVPLLTGDRVYCAASDLSITPMLVAHGIFEGDLTGWLRHRVQPGDVCVDVGANIGLHALTMARSAGRPGHVHAVEANSALVGLLADNIAVNYLAEQVTVHQAAAWHTSGSVEFHVSERFQGNSSVLPHSDWYRGFFGVDTFRTETVAAITLDELLAAAGRLSVVKIDTEGAEPHVLEGFRRTIESGRVDTIVIEHAPQRYSEVEAAAMDDTLNRMVRRGWTLAIPRADGSQQPVPLELVRRHEFIPAVILDAPHRRG